MRLVDSRLTNGLRVRVVPIPSLDSFTLCVWVRCGSRFEQPAVAGISHFLEHMVFKGGHKRGSAKEVSMAIDSIGAESNAGTSKEYTNFYIKAHKRHLREAFDILADVVLTPRLEEAEIDRERGPILEEIAMYEDNPLLKVGEVFEEVLYPHHPLGRDIAGLPKTVKTISKADMRAYIGTHYAADNMLISVAGGVEAEAVTSYAQHYFGATTQDTKKRLFAEFKPDASAPKTLLRYKKTQQANLVLGVTTGGRHSTEWYQEAVLSTILGRGMSSRLFLEIRERRGLAYSVSSQIERYSDTGYMMVYVGADLRRVSQAVEVAIDQLDGIASGKYPVTDTELSKAKEFIKGHIALSLEDTKDVCHFFGEDHLWGVKTHSLSAIYNKIDAVTKQDIAKSAKRLFDGRDYKLAVIGPFKDQDMFAKILTK